MAAHGMASNRNSFAIKDVLVLLKEQGRQFLGDVVVHVVVLVPRLLGSVYVKTGARAKVVGLVFTRQIKAARRGVGEDNCQTVLRGPRVEKALLRGIVRGTSETREVEQNGDLLRCISVQDLGRQKHIDIDAGVQDLGSVREFEEVATKGGNSRVQSKGHCVCVMYLQDGEERGRWRFKISRKFFFKGYKVQMLD